MQSSSNFKLPLSRSLKRARQKADLDQKGLAEKLGTDQSTISRIETGQNPREELNTAIHEFIEQQNAKEKSLADKVLSELHSSPEFHELINRIIDGL